MRTRLLDVTTGSTETVHDLTRDCAAFVTEVAGGRDVRRGPEDPARGSRAGVRGSPPGQDGWLNVFVPHATAGLALLELGSGSEADLLAVLAELLPADDRWRHAHGSRGHGRAHVLPAFIPPHLTIPVLGGRMALGTWQSVALIDLNVDNPARKVRMSFLGEA